MTIKEKLIESMDVETTWSNMFPDWQDGKNVPCPVAGTKHSSGMDKNPSMSLSKDGQAFCHACGFRATSPIGVYEALHNTSFEHACRELWEQNIEPLVPEKFVSSAHAKLLKHYVALARLEDTRGIGPEIVKKYRLGWDYERLIIPITNDVGYTVNVRRYDLFKQFEGSAKVISYKKGFGTGRIWPLSQLTKGAAYLFEGEMDTLVALQLGLPAVTSTSGAGSWKDEWSALFKGKDVYIVPDMDAPGLQGSTRRAQSLAKFAKTVQILKLPLTGKKDDKDFTDWVINHNGTVQNLAKLSKTVTAVNVSMEPEALADTALPGFEDLTGIEERHVARAEGVFTLLKAQGAFFRNQEHELFYVPKGAKPLLLSAHSELFLAHMTQVHPLINSAVASGKFILQHILNRARLDSIRSRSGQWGAYFSDLGALYLNTGTDELLKAKDGKLTVIENALNEEKLLLEAPDSHKKFTPKLDVDSGKAIQRIWELIGNNLPMSESHKYLILCWIFSIFFRHEIKDKPLIRLLAKTSSGKSTTSKLLSLLIYGDEVMEHSATTPAAIYAMAQKYPLMMHDNIETRNMSQAFDDFLLIAATGGEKSKREMATNSGVVREHVNCMVITNGIEPLTKREIISRTLEIALNIDRYGNSDFHAMKVCQAIKDERGVLLSGVLKMLSQYVIPRIKSGSIQRISKAFGQHSKDRFNEYLGLLAIILDAVWAFRPCKGFGEPHDLVNEWLSSQSLVTQSQDEETNEVVYFLNTFADRRDKLLDAVVVVSRENGSLKVKGSTRDMLSDFRLLAKHMGMRCPWQSERHLGTRLADAEDVLKKAGWARVRKVVSGRQTYEYVRKEKAN